jgi:hypothetical protein
MQTLMKLTLRLVRKRLSAGSAKGFLSRLIPRVSGFPPICHSPRFDSRQGFPHIFTPAFSQSALQNSPD